MGKEKINPNLHIAMYPWLGMGHLTSFLHLANKLAQNGQKISFFLPPKTQPKLAPLNHYPNLISFIPVPIPGFDGLPVGAETTNDIPSWAGPILMSAMDQTREDIDTHLARLRPDIVFFDFTQWLPGLARKYGAKSVHYYSSFMMPIAFSLPQARPKIDKPTEADILGPPPGFPVQGISLLAHEILGPKNPVELDFEGMKSFSDRNKIALEECDAIGYKTCREMEGPFCEFVRKHLEKPLLLAGPVIPNQPDSRLDEGIDGWLNGFGDGAVVYCALGSECLLEIDKFHQLLLGLELTGRPFLAALRPPESCETMESAMPKGFLERTKDRGMIHGGWVQQQLILHHPSIGCFVTHCGAGSLSEAIMSKCQILLVPHAVDQFLNSRLMSTYLRVGIEIEKRESDGYFTGEAVRKAVGLVMEEDSVVGREVRGNHDKWREVLSKEGLEESYIVELVKGLHDLKHLDELSLSLNYAIYNS